MSWTPNKRLLITSLGTARIVYTKAVSLRNEPLEPSVICSGDYKNREVKYEDNTWVKQMPLFG
jgi:hypothetical protein